MEFYKVGDMLINITKIITITKSKEGDNNHIYINVHGDRDHSIHCFNEKKNKETYNSALELYNYIDAYLSNDR